MRKVERFVVCGLVSTPSYQTPLESEIYPANEPAFHLVNIMNLPLDVVDLIIENLAGDDSLDAIRACCLSSRELVHMCRKRIFSSIKLVQLPSTDHDTGPPTDSNPPNVLSRFERLLELNPSSATFIRELELSLPEDYHSEHGLNFLQNLNHVKRFTFGFTDWNRKYSSRRPWSSVSERMVAHLHSFIQRNDIVYCHLFGINRFPLSTFIMFSNLKYLVIQNMTANNTDPWKSPLPLKSLDFLERSTRFAKQSIASKVFKMANVDKLSIMLGSSDKMDALQGILPPADRLKDLRISAYGCYPDISCLNRIASNLSPTCLTTLRTIFLNLSVVQTTLFPAFAHFDQELNQISGSNILEELEIEIYVDSGSTLDLTHSGWNHLDNLLSVRNGFPYLRKLKIAIMVDIFDGMEEVDAMQRTLDDFLDQHFSWSKENLIFEGVARAELL